MRRKTINFMVREVGIGSKHPITIQSMTNTRTLDQETTMAQVESLAYAGAQMVRIAVPDEDSIGPALAIKENSPVPIIGDVHFNPKIAFALAKAGIDGIRINPGNIGGRDALKALIPLAKKTGTAIRIGVNSGSIEKEILKKHGGPSAEAMVESLTAYAKVCEDAGFERVVLSLKASDVPTMIEANRLVADQSVFPLHIGVTEAGSPRTGIIKSSIGIGTLLSDGIGDTIRVSLTGDPLQEIPIAKEILRSLGLRKEGVNVIACPTCGRTEIDLDNLLQKIEEMTADIKTPLDIAVMGCVVNGPGEAKEADLGIAGGKGRGVIFKSGEVVANVDEDELLPRFRQILEECLEENTQ